MFGEKLRSREWLMITAILMLTEGFILYSAEVHQKSTSALNYVSFAGTVTSIVLAVIAIILSVVTTYADKSTSESMRQNVEALRMKIGVLDTISERLEGIDQQNRIVGEKLDEMKKFNEYSKGQEYSVAPRSEGKLKADFKSFMESQPAVTLFISAIIFLLNTKTPLTSSDRMQKVFINSDIKDAFSATLIDIFKSSSQIVFGTLKFLGIITSRGEQIKFDDDFFKFALELLKVIVKNDNFSYIRDDGEKLIGYLETLNK